MAQAYYRTNVCVHAVPPDVHCDECDNLTSHTGKLHCVHGYQLDESCVHCGRPVPPVKHDAVNHPKHYTSHPSGIECIEITRHMGFNLGNVMKYIWRADLKRDAIEDLEKAAWYLADEIKKRKQE